MSRDEVWKMIDEVDDNKDGRLDYGEVRSNIFLLLPRDAVHRKSVNRSDKKGLR